MSQSRDIRDGLKPGVGLYEQMRSMEPTTDNKFPQKMLDKWFDSITDGLRKHTPNKVWKLKRNLREL